MKKGLVLGKFLPFHNGHAALIDFAGEQCDELTVLVCASASESVPGEIRLQWIKEHYQGSPAIVPVLVEYDETSLPNTSVPSREAARKWAEFVKACVGKFDFVFTSEAYGDHLAEYLGAVHIPFEAERVSFPVSGTKIRKDPFACWEFLPAEVKPYFVKKICIVGTESVGKSTLTQRLAEHYNTVFVPEMARDVIEKTSECKPEHLLEIAGLHADAITAAVKNANRFLFIDTDINITRSYSRFLFGRELEVAADIDEANKADLYLYLENDAPFVQDGTRIDRQSRDLLNEMHKRIFHERGIEYQVVNLDFDNRFRQAVEIVNAHFEIGEV